MRHNYNKLYSHLSIRAITKMEGSAQGKHSQKYFRTSRQFQN